MLSNGGWDGLGKIREKEMNLAANYMGFVQYIVVDDKRIPDGPHMWDTSIVAENI